MRAVLEDVGREVVDAIGDVLRVRAPAFRR
jgi:hypothetical protein